MLISKFVSRRALNAYCASACLLIALSATSGWLFGIPVLRTFIPDGAALFPLTALGFIAVSAILILENSMHGKNQAFVRFLTVGIVFLGLVSGVLRATHWVPSPLTLASGADATVWSVPSPATSILFVAIGMSLALMRTRKSIVLAQAIAVATLLVSFLVVTGYLSRDTFLYALLPGKGTALPTALSFMLAAAGALSLHPKEGLMLALSDSETGRRTLHQLLVPALASPIVLGLLATAVAETQPVLDVDTTIWLVVWGLLIILTTVIWRFAFRLQQHEIARNLAERERKEALDALRRADERKNEFLAMLAHELRNPLAPISAATDLLRTFYASDPDQVRRTTEVISRQVDHIVHLVNDLLDVSRVTRGIIILRKEKLDARRLIAEALEQVQPLLKMKRHQLRVDLPNVIPLVEGDHTRLVQVLANLFNNAGKYTPEGGKLFVQLTTKEGQVVITVKDNGIGIAPDLLIDIFEIFTQAKRTPDRAQGGLGLGLALVKSIVELHGGTVSVQSDGLGKGSVFTVVLPCIQKEQSALQDGETFGMTK
jgi:signal transduction histidine kinase